MISSFILSFIGLVVFPAGAIAADLLEGLKSIEVTFERGHRRDRPQVHVPGLPDSDTVYRVEVHAGVEGVSVISLRLQRKNGEPVLEAKGNDGSVDIARIADDDFYSIKPTYDHSYDLDLLLSNGQRFRQRFKGEEMDSISVPAFTTPADCERVDPDYAAFAWTAAEPQVANVAEAARLQFEIIPHTDGGSGLTLSVPLPTTRLQLGVAPMTPPLKRLEPGTYRHVITQSYSRRVGAITLTRSAWNARAFVVGNVPCD